MLAGLPVGAQSPPLVVDAALASGRVPAGWKRRRAASRSASVANAEAAPALVSSGEAGNTLTVMRWASPGDRTSSRPGPRVTTVHVSGRHTWKLARRSSAATSGSGGGGGMTSADAWRTPQVEVDAVVAGGRALAGAEVDPAGVAVHQAVEPLEPAERRPLPPGRARVRAGVDDQVRTSPWRSPRWR